jgi:hypothetical protein
MLMVTITRWLSFVCLMALGPIGAIIAITMIDPLGGGYGPGGFPSGGKAHPPKGWKNARGVVGRVPLKAR